MPFQHAALLSDQCEKAVVKFLGKVGVMYAAQ